MSSCGKITSKTPQKQSKQTKKKPQKIQITEALYFVGR
jgi:hypothetical protein